MKFTLPISPNYVSHWNLWEAVREVYQNALDEHTREHTRDRSCEARFTFDDGTIRIRTTAGKLSPASLILGNTTKADGMIDGFDLAYVTSRLHTERNDDRGAELLEAEAPDVRYVASHVHAASPLVLRQSDIFTTRHGYDAVPVSTQEEIEQVSSAGMKWVLVKHPVKTLLRMVRSWFIPSTKSPVERLQEFEKRYQWNFTEEMKHDFRNILESMEPKREEQERAA